jgi:hypothetical protein
MSAEDSGGTAVNDGSTTYNNLKIITFTGSTFFNREFRPDMESRPYMPAEEGSSMPMVFIVDSYLSLFD